MGRSLTALWCFIFILSCNKTNENSSTEKINSKIDCVAVSAPDVSEPAGIPSQPLTAMDSIKQEVERINTSNLPSKRYDFICDEKAYIVYHYTGKAISKVTIDWGVVGDAYHREEFYYRNGKLIFDYDLIEGAGAYSGGDKKLERRHYVLNDKVIKYLEGEQEKPCEYCGYKKSSVPYKALAAEASKDFEKILCR
jgi:hypothetical protein